jgi:hypothetical protein
MPQVAFYRVVTDTTVLRLPTGEGSHPFTEEVTFDTTGDIVLNAGSARPMLCFQMDPTAGTDMALEVFIRDDRGADRKITTWNLSGGTSRWTMEPIKPEWVSKSFTHRLIFKTDSDGAGAVNIRNIVVMFMRNI